MKKLIVFLILAMAVSVQAATLKWDASTGATGYKIYFTDGTVSEVANVGDVTEVVDIFNHFGLAYDTTYTFSATAYNESGESAESVSVDYTTPESYSPGDIWVIPVKKTVPQIILNFMFED